MDKEFVLELDRVVSDIARPIFEQALKKNIPFEFVGPRADPVEELALVFLEAVKTQLELEKTPA